MYVYERVSKQTTQKKQTNDVYMFIFLITHMNQRRKFSLYNHATPQVTASNNAPRNSAAAFSASEWPVSESASRPLYT